MSFLAIDDIHLLYYASIAVFSISFSNKLSFVLGSSFHVCTCPGKSFIVLPGRLLYFENDIEVFMASCCLRKKIYNRYDPGG